MRIVTVKCTRLRNKWGVFQQKIYVRVYSAETHGFTTTKIKVQLEFKNSRFCLVMYTQQQLQ